MSVFICYRRSTFGWARVVYENLAVRFGKSNVFFDAEGIQAGADFEETLKNAILNCSCMVVVIGSNWRIDKFDERTDHVRREIELAMQNDLKIFPVLVESASMPLEADLPANLSAFSRRQARSLPKDDLLKVALNGLVTDLRRADRSLSIFRPKLLFTGALASIATLATVVIGLSKADLISVGENPDLPGMNKSPTEVAKPVKPNFPPKPRKIEQSRPIAVASPPSPIRNEEAVASQAQTALKSVEHNIVQDCSACPELIELTMAVNSINDASIEVAFSRFETTNEEYQLCVNAGDCEQANLGNPDQPVTGVRLESAIAYANWLSRKTGKSYRLPTEKEWVFAARAGVETSAPSGPRVFSSEAVYDAENGPTKFGSKQPNSFGLYDMLGNVWEWVVDCDKIIDLISNSDNLPISECEFLLKGGSWRSQAETVTYVNEYRIPYSKIVPDAGFRVVRIKIQQ